MNVKFKILGLAMLVTFGLFGCLPEQELADPISPDKYPVATFTTDFTGTTINEGDTITYTITIDKPLDRALNFEVKVLEGTTAEDGVDFMWQTCTIAPYTTEGELQIIVADDGFPEAGETLKIEIGDFGMADTYLLNPSTVNPVLNLSVTNVNWDGGVTIGFLWENHDEDFDIFSIADVGGDWNLAATSDDPEIMGLLWNEDADDTYRLTVDPYSVEGTSSNYIIAIGYPDQTVHTVEGTFDYTNRDTEYPMVFFTAWGMDTYELLNVVKSGSTLTTYTYDGTLVGTGTIPAGKSSVRYVDFSRVTK